MRAAVEDICERYRALSGAWTCLLVRARTPREAFALLGDPAAHDLRLQVVSAIDEPGVHVADLRALSRRAREQGECLVVDNSVPTAFGCAPLLCGAVMCFEHLSGGIAVLSVAKPQAKRAGADELALRAHAYLQEAASQAALTPGEADMLARHLDMLGTRMQRRFDNARALAEYLAANEHVSRVCYPGLEDHPDHQVAAATLLHGFGPLLEFEPRPHADLQALTAACSPAGGESGETRTLLAGCEGAKIVRLWAGEDNSLAVIDRIDPILRA